MKVQTRSRMIFRKSQNGLLDGICFLIQIGIKVLTKIAVKKGISVIENLSTFCHKSL